MAVLILNPRTLARLCDSEIGIEVPDLEVKDCRDHYDMYDGDGVWIPSYVCFLEKIVSDRCHLRDFTFSDNGSIRGSLFDEIPSDHVRTLLVEFTNQYYTEWRESDVSLPDYDEVRSDCRSFCEDCEYAYEQKYGTYDGPLADEVEDDEDEHNQSVCKQERHERQRRNRERTAERERRQLAQDDAESEVVDSEWICDSDCDSFLDHVSCEYRDQFDGNTPLLQRRFEKFLIERGEKNFPALIIELAQRRL